MSASIDWERFRGRTTFIIGDDKNSGKTTFLKRALGALRERGLTLAYLSAGVDGERFDLISGAPKPLIVAEVGDYLVTSESAVAESEAEFEVVERFAKRTVLGHLELLRTRRPGLVELVGPETNRALADVLSAVRSGADPDAVLVDGAVDRVTQVSSAVPAGYVLAMRVDGPGLQGAARRVRLALLLDGIERHEGPDDTGGCWALEGALTEGKLEKIPGACETLVLEDFTRVFLDYPAMARLVRDRRVAFREVFELMFLVVVLDGVTREQFFEALGPESGAALGRVVFEPYAPMAGR